MAAAQDGPLGRFLKELFGTGPKRLDLIDRHAASASRELARSLEQCDALVASRQWDAAIRQLQYIVELPEDALVPDGRNWISIKRRAEKKLLALPEEGRRLYLNQYAEAAREELANARERGDFEGIRRVAARYRMTEAGESAADEVAGRLADAGDFIAAAQWLLELDRDGAGLTKRPEWRSRTAAILEKVGHHKAARGFDPASTALNASGGLAKTSPSAWTELYGGPARLNSVAGDRPLLLEEWSAPGTEAPSLREDIEQRQEDLFAGSVRPIPVANAVAANGLMGVRTVGGLEVREVSSGRLLWKARGANTAEPQLVRGLTNVGGTGR
jgi:hypothetical protein